MPDYFLTQIAEAIVAAAVDFIKSGRTIPGVKIEGPWDEVLAGQRPYDEAIATIPCSVVLLDSLSLEARTAALRNLFETDHRYECAWDLTERTAFHSPITLAVHIENAWRERVARTW